MRVLSVRRRSVGYLADAGFAVIGEHLDRVATEVCILYVYSRLRVEFDPAKNWSNVRKHGVDFADVEGVLWDPFAITVEDRDHSEQLFLTLGMDAFGRLLVVCHAPAADDVIRVISARRAAAAERRQYEGT